MADVRCVTDAANRLGEVPVWDDRAQALYWVDIGDRLLQRLDHTTGVVARWTMPDRIAAVAVREAGSLTGRFGIGCDPNAAYLSDRSSAV